MKKTALALTLGLLIGSAGTAMAATSDTVQAVFAKFNFMVNGAEKKLAVDPLVVDGTSYLPVREVAGLLGYQLDYDPNSRTIKLDNTTKGADKMPTATLTNKVESRALLNFIAEKYGMAYKDGLYIAMHPENQSIALLNFKGEKIQLQLFADGSVDASPLIEKGIISKDDIEKIEKMIIQ